MEYRELQGLLWWLRSKESACSAGDLGSRSSLGQDDPPEKEMTTHSSILAGKISWTEESGKLPSMRSQESDMT